MSDLGAVITRHAVHARTGEVIGWRTCVTFEDGTRVMLDGEVEAAAAFQAAMQILCDGEG